MNTFSRKSFARFCLVTILLIIFAEFFAFNYKTFLINPFNASKYTQRFFSVEDATYKGLEYNKESKTYRVTSDNPTIFFDINMPVKTMALSAQKVYDKGHTLDAKINYSTTSCSSYRKSPKSFSITPYVKNSKYVTCSYFGSVINIALELDATEGETIKLDGLQINPRIPFSFSFLRVIALFTICFLLYLFFRHPIFKSSLNLENSFHIMAIYATIFSFVFLVVVTYFIYVGDVNWLFNESGNQMTEELVDAFENGSVSLLDEVPKGLLSLKDPYDINQRIESGINIKWDHLLYNGKYYSYYGIAPVITLFLPYHMITGYYFSSSLACLLYTLGAAIFVPLCFLSIVKNWFKRTNLNIVILGMITTFFSSCALINVMSYNFYEIAQSSALFNLSIGFFFMLNSGIFTKDKIKLCNLFLSSLFMSLGVLSRATCGLYAIAMVIWIIYGFFQYKKQNNTIFSTVKYIAFSITPYIIFGSMQMIYNYLRFGNPLEFGIKYTLTIYNYLNIDMHFSLIMVSIVNMLFTLPVVNSTFPFIHDNFDSLGVNGYYFIATKPAFGVFPSVLPALSIFYAPKLAGRFNLYNKIKLCLIWLIPGVIMPVILVAMTWQYGYAMRYYADFGWQLCLAGFTVILYVYARLKNPSLKKWLFYLLFAATIWCSSCYMSDVLATNPIDAVAKNLDGAAIYYKLKSLITFWE